MGCLTSNELSFLNSRFAPLSRLTKLGQCGQSKVSRVSNVRNVIKKFLNANDKEAVLDKLGIDDMVLNSLPALKALVEDNLTFISNAVFDHILKEPIMGQYLKDPRQLDRLRLSNQKSIQQLFDGTYDDEFILKRIYTGFNHFSGGVKASSFMAATCQLQTTMCDLIHEAFPIHRANTFIIAVSRLINFENYLALETYYHTRQVLMNEKLEDTRGLIRVVTHDISGPLTVIGLKVKIMARKATADDIKKYEVITHKLDQVFDIISNIRDTLAYSTGKKQLKLSDITLDDLIEELDLLFRERFEMKSVGLSFANKVGDRAFQLPKIELIHSILGNILSNALKFSKAKGVVSLIFEMEDGLLKMSVSDEGVGIPSDILNQIFSSTARTSRKGTDGEPGTGFGMPIVKMFVDRMGGNVEIKSITIDEDPDHHGTTISISLPGQQVIDFEDVA